MLRSSRLCALGCLLLTAALPAFAQYSKPVCSNGKNNTTISGVVYSPNGQDPLPDVLVYVPDPASGPVQITDGVTKADLRPVNPVTETTTAYDGSFTLTDAPAGQAVQIVIQSGKWQRVLPTIAVTACQDNVPPNPANDKFARFPRNKSEGYIPRIAVVTGAVEATECVLRKVGMDDAEFTNFSSGGRINLYTGGSRPGSSINSTTPTESTLMTDTSQLNAFDLLVFPCQGTDQVTTDQGKANLVSFANNGGRIFINHHSHAWLKNNTGFANTFNWGADGAQAADGAATIDQTFTIGATLALWLQNLGQTTAAGDVSVTRVFASLSSITSSAQQWISLNSNSLPIQASFDTPVGAAAGSSYGRVLYNEYHVSPTNYGNSTPPTYPNECSGTALSQQEKILEFSLFDLSSFAAIVKVDANMTVTPPSQTVKYGGTATLTATLTTPSGSTYGTPTGAVTFSEGTTTFGTVVLHAGVGSTTLSGLPVGTHTITAVYSGDPFYKAQTQTATVIVYPQATVNVAASPNPVLTGHASTIVFTAAGSSTSPTPTGTVAITVDGGTTTYALSGGVATVPAKIYTNGPHPITAVYSGDANYDTQTATRTLYVQVESSTSLSVNAPNVFLLNPAVFTATTAASGGVVPTGTAIFYEGSTVLGTVALSNGAATLSLSNLPFGQHTVTAFYSGDNYYGPSTTSNVVENVMDYQLTITSSPISIAHSTTATYTFTLTPLGGTAMPSAILMAIANTRPGSVVTLSPATVAAGSGAVTVTATIKTADGPSTPPELQKISLLRVGGGGMLAALVVLPFAGQRRKYLARGLLLVLAGLALSAGVTGCGTGWKTLTYGMELNTASGALSHSQALTLTETGGN